MKRKSGTKRYFMSIPPFEIGNKSRKSFRLDDKNGPPQRQSRWGHSQVKFKVQRGHGIYIIIGQHREGRAGEQTDQKEIKLQDLPQ